jgi:histone H3/H4
MSNEILNIGFDQQEATSNSSLEAVAESRATAEVQAAYVIAKKFPRNQFQSYSDIMSACKRVSLAEQAEYIYPRGGKTVRGASIRLAEAICQTWGNIDAGVREISQENGVSVAEAYAIDLQTNTRITKIFHVKHDRHTKQGTKRLTDPRDIYELVANQGARRLRSCILALIPGDVVEAAVNQCRETLKKSDVPLADRIKKVTLAFNELGVKVEHIEKKLGHPIANATIDEVIELNSIGRTIKEGIAKREDFFEISSSQVHAEAKETINELLKNKKVDLKTGEVKEHEQCEEAKEFFKE